MKKYSVLLFVVAVLAVLASCGGLRPETAPVTFAVGDKLGAKIIMPDVSLDADHFVVHGVGTSGQADGETFDLVVPAVGGTATIELRSGEWTVQAVAWNDDTPQVAVGDSAQEPLTVVVGVPQTVQLDCFPYSGTGTFSIDASWFPAVITSPQVTVTARTFAGVDTAIPMVVQPSNVQALGSAVLNTGTYVAFLQLMDNGVLSAGKVETLRIAKDATSSWAPYFDVDALEGSITFDVTWTPYSPLALTTSPAEGTITQYDGQTVTLSVTGADNDGGTTLVYAWYKNGNPVAISTTASLDVLPAELEVGTHAYYSCVVWQSDGLRAGDAQWRINREAMPAEAFTIEALVRTATAGSYQLRIYDAAEVLVASEWLPVGEYVDAVLTSAALPAGSYKVMIRGTADTWYGGADFATATAIVLPQWPRFRTALFWVN